MFENINDGDHITLKLASGEEVIAKYKSGQDSYISCLLYTSPSPRDTG